MKKVAKVTFSIVLGILILSTNHVSGQTVNSTQEKQSAVHFSFIPPLSTNGLKAGEYTNGASFSLLVGISKNEKAFSFAGLSNIVKNDVTGFQFAGLGNVAGDVNGFQFGGLFNVAKNVKGVQFAGLVNIAQRSDYPIGILNFIKEGEYSISATYNDLGSTMVSFRSGGKVTYGILGVGYNGKMNNNSFVAEGGFGAHINITNWFRINNEIKGGSNIGSSLSKSVFYTNYAFMPAFRLTHNVELFGGPNINYLQTENLENSDLFPKQSLWKKHTDSKLQQLYIGYQFGIQYVF